MKITLNVEYTPETKKLVIDGVEKNGTYTPERAREVVGQALFARCRRAELDDIISSAIRECL